MTGPRVQPSIPPAERRRLLAAGFSPEEIDAEYGPDTGAVNQPTPPRPGLKGFAAESTTARPSQGAPEAFTRGVGDWARDLTRQGAQGLSFGGADEAEAAAWRAARKLGVDTPYGDRDYTAIRNVIRGQNAAFANDHPALALGANVAGGMATGGGLAALAKKAPWLATIGLAPKANAGASLAAKMGQAAKLGAVGGAVTGVGMADEMEDVPGAVLGYGLGGAVLGPAFVAGAAGASRLGGGLRRMGGPKGPPDMPGGGGGAPPVGPRALPPAGGSSAPKPSGEDRAAVRSVLRMLDAKGQSLDDFAAASATADEADIIAEVLGKKGVQRTTTTRALGHTAPDRVEAALTRRARDEAGRVHRAFTEQAGEQLDDEAFAIAKLQEAQDAAGPFYRSAEAIVPDQIAPEVEDVVGTLKSMREFGGPAIKRAETLAAARKDLFPKRFTTEATPDEPSPILDRFGAAARVLPGKAAEPKPTALRHIFDIRRGMDEVMREMKKHGDSPAILREMEGMRARLDAVAKNAGEPFDDVVRQADDVYAGPVQEIEAFTEGQKVARNIQAVDLPRVLGGKHTAMTARGVANTIHDDFGALQRGDAGPIRNPAPLVIGSDKAEARLLASMQGDQAKADLVRKVAEGAQRRLGTYRSVLQGSQTAEKLADQADVLGSDPVKMVQAARNPIQAALGYVGQKAQEGTRYLVGRDMDALAKVLMAGAPGEMSRADAVAMVREMMPLLEQQMANQLRRTNAVQRGVATTVGQRGGARQ